MSQLLELPITQKAMTVGFGYQGVTILTQSQYRVRYSGPADYVQVPIKGWIKKPRKMREPKSKKRKWKINKPQPQKLNRPRVYIINKSVVSSRIKAFINQQSGKKELYFWTVTFPEKTEDATALLLLNKWFTRLRQEKLLHSYLWVNERQQNGTLHYHIAIPHRLDVKKANRYMRASIITCIDNKEINWTREQAKNYNGVDLAKHRNTRRIINFALGKRSKSLANYLTKYVTKNDQSYNQLAWHNSRDFSNLIIRVNITEKEFARSSLRKFISAENPLVTEHFTFYRWKGSPPVELMMHFSFVQSLIKKIT
jgi:hypothetical protein